MTKMKRANKGLFTYIVPALGAIAIAGMCLPTGAVSAAGNEVKKMSVIELKSSDPYANDTLKTYAIKSITDSNSNLEYEDIDIDNSVISVSGLNLNKPGIQAVTINVNLAKIDDATKSVGYNFTESAAINVVKSSNPVIKLKKQSVTVNNGDTFNPSSYISTISDDSGILPVLKVSDNVDMNEDGDYYASYTAIDTEGNSTTTVLNVTVKTPQEVIDQRAEESAEQERIEAEKKAEEERKEQEAALAAANSAGSTNKVYGTSGVNPYSGGWSNCTYGAWEAAYESTGVALPNLGNAWEWLGRAQSYGYATGGTPAAGSVAVYSHHVAYVDAVSADGSAVHIIEGGMNGGYYERWVSASGTGTQALSGYIYLG